MPDDLAKPDLYVVARFLERLWRDERPHRKTDLQMAVRLNYGLYQKYLAWLAKKELVVIVPHADGSERVAITPKGLDTYHKIAEWIRDVVGDEHLR